MMPGISASSAASSGASGGTEKTVFITATGTFNVPGDFASLVAIEAIAGGSGGITAAGFGKAGGGGAYSKITSLALSAGQALYVNIGAAGVAGVNGGVGVNGGDTWLNKTTNAAPASTSDGLLAKGGTVSSSGGFGGAATSGVGTTKYNGGDGNSYTNAGGAGGPDGAGGNGTSSNGGAGNAGQPGGGAGGYGLAGIYDGGNGDYWTQTSDGTKAGPGGGGVLHTGTTSGKGGNYGGGGGGNYGGTTAGAGAPGIIVFRYLST